jgi:hypothetical protein
MPKCRSPDGAQRNPGEMIRERAMHMAARATHEGNGVRVPYATRQDLRPQRDRALRLHYLTACRSRSLLGTPNEHRRNREKGGGGLTRLVNRMRVPLVASAGCS